MALHFSMEEFAGRQSRLRALLAERRLDGLLIFRQESMYYLTGYDTSGYVRFQCLYFGADGALTLLTRSADFRQAHETSIIKDVRVWVDRADANPGMEVRETLRDHGCRGKRIGIELDATGLTARHGRMVEEAFDGFCVLEDASDIVSRLRLVKSAAELVYVRRAAELADDAFDQARPLAVVGAFEGDILAAMLSAVFRGGGDYPSSRFIVGSGPGALMVRYFSGRRHLDPTDQLQLEFGAAYREYHACLMRTVLVGAASPIQRDMHRACVDALQACQYALAPGRTMGEVFDAHARVMDVGGYKEHRLNACGYSLGATYPPTWMDWPMFFTGNQEVVATDMIFFLHMILLDSTRGLAMSLGETVRVTSTGCERLSRLSHELVVN
jgi:Xaa-Pro dipeptidase